MPLLALRSQVRRIGGQQVLLDRDGDSVSIDNDAVLVCVGGVLPTPMLKELGIAVETRYGTA